MNIGAMVGQFIDDSKRIFLVSKKPTMDEYKRMALIVAIGMILIGILAFIVYLAFALTGIGF